MDDAVLRGLISLGGLPFILALTQLCKGFVTNTKYYPLISVAMGLVVNILAAVALGLTTGQELAVATIQGLVAGLAASGLYSAASTIKEGAAADKANRVPLPSNWPEVRPGPRGPPGSATGPPA